MSDKLSGLDKLIMEMMLQEKNLPISIDLTGDQDLAYDRAKDRLNIKTSFPFGAKGKEGNVDNLKTLMSLDGNESELSSDDFEKAFDFGTKAEPKRPNKKARKAASAIRRKTGDNTLKKDIDKVQKQVSFDNAKASDFETGEGKPIKSTGIEAASFSFPRVYNSLASSTAGAFLGSQNELINSIFSQPNMKERLEELSKISQILQDPEKIGEITDPKKLLEYTMMVELVDYLFNQIDERAKGGFLESFLALLVGGKVVGSSGGVADFETAAGQKGSAKFYSDYSSPKQATVGFKYGEPVHYVVAVRKGEQKASVGKIDYIDLYYIVWTQDLYGKEWDDKTWNRFVASDAQGNEITRRWVPNKSDIKITKDIPEDRAKIGTIALGKPNENFIKVLNDKMKNEKTDTGKAYRASQKYFKQLFRAEERAKEFIAFKEPRDSNNKSKPEFITKGNKALGAYSEARGGLTTLLRILSGGSISKGELVGENKKKLLDKLIEEVILSTTMEEE